MPGMDGLTLARAISAELPIASTRLVALTSLGHTYSTEFSLANIDGYLAKPIKQWRLFDCLASTLGRIGISQTVAKSDQSALQ
jgi:CheY-like chemotaxis protein